MQFDNGQLKGGPITVSKSTCTGRLSRNSLVVITFDMSIQLFPLVKRQITSSFSASVVMNPRTHHRKTPSLHRESGISYPDRLLQPSLGKVKPLYIPFQLTLPIPLPGFSSFDQICECMSSLKADNSTPQIQSPDAKFQRDIPQPDLCFQVHHLTLTLRLNF